MIYKDKPPMVDGGFDEPFFERESAIELGFSMEHAVSIYYFQIHDALTKSQNH